MANYLEEQTNEIEALLSIYPEELKVLSTDPFHCFQLYVTSQSTRRDVTNASCTLQFTYTAKYPDEVPRMSVEDESELDEDQVKMLSDLMQQLAEENLGMVMVFIIYSAVQEKLNDIVEKAADMKNDEEIRKQRELEEAEQKRFEGTRITVETFLAWKTKFDAEMAELKSKTVKEEVSNKKLTGKEMFMLSNAMDDSDVKFLEDGGEVVEVDESLFDDIEDLNLEDDEDEETKALQRQILLQAEDS